MIRNLLKHHLKFKVYLANKSKKKSNKLVVVADTPEESAQFVIDVYNECEPTSYSKLDSEVILPCN
jgi:hypothetical protein